MKGAFDTWWSASTGVLDEDQSSMTLTQRSFWHWRAIAWLVAIAFMARLPARSQQPAPAADPVPNAPSANTPERENLFARWAHFYAQDWAPSTNASSSPALARRGPPSPLDSPPFPNSDWSYGGSPVIGEPDSNSYPLMTAINNASSRTKLYGWIDPTLNFSTSSHLNSPEANDLYPNRLEMNQLVLYAERLPDSVQRSHIDWGYHLTALYGTDYRFTFAKRLFQRPVAGQPSPIWLRSDA
jgi:hypothetical protein